MATQKGIIKLKGTIGDITFYKSQDGFLARGKGGADPTRIATDPAFQRTRENMAEFAAAARAVKLLRTSLRALLQNSADSRIISRLTQAMVKVIKADATNQRGKRTVVDSETQLLEGFECNIHSQLGSTLFAPYTAAIDRVAGTLSVNLPAFIPINMVSAPPGSTHFKITSAGTAVDFVNETFVTDTHETAELPLDNVATAVIDLVNTVAANSTNALFLAMGIEFFQLVNGVQYPLKNGAFNALSIVKVNGA